MTKSYYIYIMMNLGNTVVYTGDTNNLLRRVYEHKHKLTESFTSRYKVTKLVYFEEFQSIWDAIRREKQIKGGSRIKKLALVRSINPGFEDIYLKFQ